MTSLSIRVIIVAMFFCLFSNCFAQVQDDWETLFNGKNLDNWTTKIHHYEVGDNHGDTFRVNDSTIQVRYDKYEGDFNDRFSHLYFDKPYSYFHLTLEYRFVGEVHPGAPVFVERNSGVMFHSEDPKKMLSEQNWPISVEMQFLGGVTKGKSRPTGNMCSPGTDVEFEGKIDPRHCISSSSKTYYGDQWVKADLIVLGDSLVTHIINDEEVLQYTKPQLGRTGVVKGARTEMNVSGRLLKEGFIALQSEGQPVDFRNIKIKNLKGCIDPKAINYKNYYIEPDAAACNYR